MKSKIIIIALLAALAAGLATRTKADPRERGKPAVILVRAYEPVYNYGYGDGQGGIQNYAWSYGGFFLQNTGSSSNAPTFEIPVFALYPGTNNPELHLINMAQFISDRLAEGYTYRQDGLNFTFVKQ